MPLADPYVAAKANLRDNVKTLITVFGGVAAVLLAGTPFTGYGALEPYGKEWWVASVSLVLALVLTVVALRILLAVLHPDLAYAEALRDPTAATPASWFARHEVTRLHEEFARHRDELLPADARTFDALVERRREAWNAYHASSGNAALQAQYEQRDNTLQRLLFWTAFVRFHARVQRGVDVVLCIGIAAVVAIAVFALAANRKPKDADPQVIVANRMAPVQTKEPMPQATTLYFTTGSSSLSADAIAGIAIVRKQLLGRPDAGVLIYAHTDTQGASVINRVLARKRADAVAIELEREGGISESRVSASLLPETALPTLTGPKVAHRENRVVQLQLIELPAR